MSHPLVSAARLLEAGRDLCLVTIVSQKGSTPRPVGTAFLVPGEGEPMGSVGGGAMEAFAVNEAREALAQGSAGLARFALPSLPSGAAGMACGGEVDLYLEPFWARDEDGLKLLQAAAGLLEAGDKAIMLSRVEPGDTASPWGRKLLLPTSGEALGGLELSPGQVRRLSLGARKLGAADLRQIEHGQGGEWAVFVQPLLPSPTLYIMGSGHVARELAVLADFLEYRLVLVDDRPDMANAQRFPQAQQILVRGLEDAFAELMPGAGDMVVIMTRGHAQDLEVLAQALNLPFGYVGMLGSAKKRKTIFKALSERGYSQSDLDRVHSPIGLPIGAETPREIALAIAAELLKSRSNLDIS